MTQAGRVDRRERVEAGQARIGSVGEGEERVRRIWVRRWGRRGGWAMGGRLWVWVWDLMVGSVEGCGLCGMNCMERAISRRWAEARQG